MVVRGLVKKAMPLARSGELIENYFLVGETLLARRWDAQLRLARG